MSMEDRSIRLYVPPRPAARAVPEAPNRLSREEENQDELHAGFWAKISIDKLQTQLSEMQSKIGDALGKLASSTMGSMTLEEVTVGLTISVEGDIGIASAGAEASIELTFKITERPAR